MTVKRHAGWLATALLTVSLLGACGGSDDEPTVKPTSDAPAATSAAPDPDGFTPEQREVADAVQKWNAAVFSGTTDTIGTTLQGIATQKVIDGVTAAEADLEPAEYLGDVTLDVTTVTVTGDAATVEGCRDGSKATRVKKGETEAGVGDSTVGTAKLTVGLVRQDGAWLIDDPRAEPVATC